jgi:CubicO group peptidase (beta-lactamase class C family)
MKRILYLTILIVVFGCGPEKSTNENPTYPKEIEDKITRITENIRIETQFWNKYDTSTLDERLAHYKTPGISIAVINNGKLEWARGFGYRNVEKKEPVTQNTLFQVASISKPLVGLVFIKLLEKNEIDIDTNVNGYLKSWKIPSNSEWEPLVTIRQLLSHTAGFTVGGFPGYSLNDEIPTTVQVLNGEFPSNTGAIEVNIIPGTRLRYSGGGITIAQLILEDKFNKPFYEIMDSLLLTPLNLINSTYQQPISKSHRKLTATGYLSDYQAITGGHHIYPEMAAAGLWTTPAELSNIVTEVQMAVQNKSKYISSRSINEMLTPQIIAPEIGIGFFLNGKGDSLIFQHNGGNHGFSSQLMGYKGLGKGAIVMINSNEYEIINEVMRAIAFEYNWPDFIKENTQYSLDIESLEPYKGKYVSEEGWDITISQHNDQLRLEMLSQPPVYLIPESDHTFYSEQLNIKVEFIAVNGVVEKVEIQQDWWKKISAKKVI